MSTTPSLYDERDPQDLPAELQPLLDVDWEALSSPEVHRILALLPPSMLRDVPGDNATVRGLLALGIGIRFAGGLVPTVAGVVAFGERPEEVLPGMSLRISAGVAPLQEPAGSLDALLSSLTRIRERSLSTIAPPWRVLLSHALAWRSWDEEDIDAPLWVEDDEDQLVIHLPGQIGETVTNPVLADLLWRRGLAPEPDASLGSLERAMRVLAPEGADLETDHHTTTLRFELRQEPPRSSRASEVRPSRRRRLRHSAAPVRSTSTDRRAPRPPPVQSVPASPRTERGARSYEPTRTGPTAPARRPEPPLHKTSEERQRELVRHLAAVGPTSRRDLQAQLGWSRSTLRDVLRAAIDAGTVEALTEHPRSPFQAYRVAPGAREGSPTRSRWP